jgi:hypothetical protein
VRGAVFYGAGGAGEDGFVAHARGGAGEGGGGDAQSFLSTEDFEPSFKHPSSLNNQTSIIKLQRKFKFQASSRQVVLFRTRGRETLKVSPGRKEGEVIGNFKFEIST